MEAYNHHPHHQHHHHSLDVDVSRMFDQYLYKDLEENIDVSLSVPQYNSPQTMLHPQQPQQQQQQQQHHAGGGLTNGSHHSFDMNGQGGTFHTSTYGEDDFDISSLNPAAPQATQQQSQMSHAHVGGHLNHGQQNTYQMHHHATPPHHYNQWHPEQQQQQQQTHMTHSQSYQMPQQQQQANSGPNNSYGMTSPAHQQMLMPQMSPQISNHNNFMGRSPPQQQPQQQQQNNLGGVVAGGGQQLTGGPSDDSDDNGLINPLKRQSPDLSGDSNSSPTGGSNSNNGVTGGYMKSGPSAATGPANKKPKVQKKKKKRDPNEPQKPVSAYALFFRDTQAAIKGQNPNASFGEVSKIVASMWDVLATEHKNVYKKKTEAAKKEYLKALAAYRASLVSKGSDSESPQSAIYTSPAAPGQMQSPPEPNSPQGSGGHQQQPPHHSQQVGGGPQQMPGISPHRQQQQQQYHRPHLQMTGQETSSPGYPPNYKSPQPHHPQMMSMVNSHHMGQQQQQQQHNMHLSQMQHMQQHPQQMGHLMGAGSLHEPQIPHYMNPQLQQPIATAHPHPHHHLQQQQQMSQHHQLMHSHSGGDAHQSAAPQQNLAPSGNQMGSTGGGAQQMMMNGGGGGGGGAGEAGNEGHALSPSAPGAEQVAPLCIRTGCTNNAVPSSDWEDEYCSNECVITHCRDVFGNWVQNSNGQQPNVYPSVVK